MQTVTHVLSIVPISRFWTPACGRILASSTYSGSTLADVASTAGSAMSGAWGQEAQQLAGRRQRVAIRCIHIIRGQKESGRRAGFII